MSDRYWGFRVGVDEFLIPAHTVRGALASENVVKGNGPRAWLQIYRDCEGLSLPAIDLRVRFLAADHQTRELGGGGVLHACIRRWDVALIASAITGTFSIAPIDIIAAERAGIPAASIITGIWPSRPTPRYVLDLTTLLDNAVAATAFYLLHAKLRAERKSNSF